MKLQLTAIVLTAGLSVLLGSSTLKAQDQKAVANIPFAYHVGHQTFSPGKYTVAKGSLPGVFALRETGAGHDIFIPVLPHNTGDKEAWNLTFSCRPLPHLVAPYHPRLIPNVRQDLCSRS